MAGRAATSREELVDARAAALRARVEELAMASFKQQGGFTSKELMGSGGLPMPTAVCA